MRYGHLGEGDRDYAQILKDDGSVIINFANVSTRDEICEIPVYDGKYTIKWTKDASWDIDADAFWIYSIGDFEFHEPQLPEENTVEVKIKVSTNNISVDNSILDGAKLRIYNNSYFDHEYEVNEEHEVIVKLPKDDTFFISSKNFMIGSKVYFADSAKTIDTRSSVKDIDYVFTTYFGYYAIDENGNFDSIIDGEKNYLAALYASDDFDIFVLKTQNSNMSYAWSTGNEDEGIVYNDTLESLREININGYENSKMIKASLGDKATAVNVSYETNVLTSMFDWYLPSYNELLQANSDAGFLNFMINIGDDGMAGRPTWTSNPTDAENAWLFNGGTATPVARTESNIIRVFGRYKI